MSLVFKSPVRKIIPSLFHSRENWKSKHKNLQKKHKNLKRKYAYSYSQISSLKEEIFELKINNKSKKMVVEKQEVLEGEYIPFKQQFIEPVKRHHYSIGYMTSYITLMLRSISMRSIERILNFFSPLIPNFTQAPTWYSGRLWMMKVGYYKLHKAKEKADDWVWIIDHLVQAGSIKCFVVLGIRVKDIPNDRPLSREDVEALAVMPVKTSNGTIVYEQLQAIALKYGVPCAIVGDHGPDIYSGVKQFCKLSEITIHIYDIKHAMAALLKSELHKDETWQSFSELAAMGKKYMHQTDIAGLMPPNQKSKSRYMNIDTFVAWGIKIMKRLDEKDYPTNIDEHKVQCKLGWLPFFRKNLNIWDRILMRVSYTEHHIRIHGYYIGVTSQIQTNFNKMDRCDHSLSFQNKILNIVFKEEAKLTSVYPKMLGSSEIIESIFGSYKDFSKDKSSNGFTGLLLVLPAMISNISKNEIKSAIERTTIKQIRKWVTDWIGETIYAQRVAWLGKTKAERNWYEELAT